MKLNKQRSFTGKILFYSVLAWITWIIEIRYIKGWYSLSWIHDLLYSPFVIIFITAYSYLLPFRPHTRQQQRKFFAIWVILSIVNALLYLSGKTICYSAYHQFFSLSWQELLTTTVLSLSLFLAAGAAYQTLTKQLVAKTSAKDIVRIAVYLLLTLPLSYISILLLPGFGSGHDWVDATKMGYPVFWATLLTGMAGNAIARRQEIVFTKKTPVAK